MRFTSIVFLIISASMASQVLAQTGVQQIDVNAVYRLSNDFAGPGKSLSVRGGTVTMADTGDATDQLWKLVSVGGGKYRLVNTAAGSGKSLDNAKSGDQFSVTIGGTGSYSGQFWTLMPVAGGKYRLTNDYASGAKSLDARKSGDQFSVVMGDTGNYSGQFWTLTTASQAIVINPVPVITNPNNVIKINPVSVITNPNQSVVVVPATSGQSIPITPLPGNTGQPPSGGPQLTFNNLIIPWDPNKIPKGGTLICSADLRASTNCGVTKANWVGTHEIKMKCEKGFYDPIWGGTCWDFPPENDGGKWVRGTTAVTADDAVWRAPKEALVAATKVKKTGLAWECASGTFWDGFGTGGAGCWQCPSDHPRRTANPVGSSKACATDTNQTAKAVFVGYNGCPKPDARDMGLAGKRMPGKPFLDVGGGGCYACPNADEDGNILITERNANPVKGDQGCTIRFKWKSPDFPEPGMSGLIGVKEILIQNLVFDNPDVVTLYLMEAAKDLRLQPGTASYRAYMERQWQDIAEHPYQNSNLSNLAFGFLEIAVQTPPDARTPAEKKLVAAVEQYVSARRTFIAEQALAMYDGWKDFDDRAREKRLQRRLDVMGFDYGTVPLDFHSAALAGFGLGAAGSATAVAIVGANARAAGIAKLTRDAIKTGKDLTTALRDVQKAESLANLTRGLAAFRAMALITQFATLGPAIVIEVVGGILISIAIDQYIAIIEARSKLEAAVTAAKSPVDLKAMYDADGGKDQLTYFWSKAMDVKSAQEDPGMVAKAHAALELARQRGFQIGSAQ